MSDVVVLLSNGSRPPNTTGGDELAVRTKAVLACIIMISRSHGDPVGGFAP